MNSTQAAIRREAAKLAGLKQTSSEATGPIGYLVGAAYALGIASELGYRATHVQDARYAAALRLVARRIRSDTPSILLSDRTLRPWLARFYFNSALHRIAAAADRLGVHPKGRFPEPLSIRRVREDVNKLKHDIKQDQKQRGRGLLQGRDVSMAVALSALRALTGLCRREGLI